MSLHIHNASDILGLVYQGTVLGENSVEGVRHGYPLELSHAA